MNTYLKNRCNLRRRSGAATLELAFVLMLLLTITFGTIEYGQYFYIKNQLQGAAREGARAAITSGSSSADVTSAVATVMTTAGLQGISYTVSTTPSTITSTAPTSGNPVTVSVQLTWSSVGGAFRVFSLVGNNKVVRGTAVMRRE